MFTIGKKLLVLVLLALFLAAPLACVNINKPADDDRPKRDVSVGGQYGVNVDRSDSGTEVKVGGDRGVVVEHPRD